MSAKKLEMGEILQDLRIKYDKLVNIYPKAVEEIEEIEQLIKAAYERLVAVYTKERKNEFDNW